MARPPYDTPLVIQALEISLEYELGGNTYLQVCFVLFSHLLFTPHPFEIADLISCDLHERERDPLW
jgi:hypothetical protein